MEVSLQLPADQELSHSVGQSSTNELGPQSQRSAIQDQNKPRLTTDDWERQQPGEQLDFQDSNLSPALLLPVNSGVDHNFTEYSIFQQSDNEFAPLRAYPDISVASDRFHLPLQDRTTQASERGSLSQHPLAQATILSEEGASSCCSLSQHSFSPGDEGRREQMVQSRLTTTTDRQGVPSRDDAGSKEKSLVKLTQDKLERNAEEDETFFLNKDIPAQHLMKLLQKDVGMPSSSSSSAVSSASETSVKNIASFAEGSKITKVCKPGNDQSMVRREGPPGEASLPEQTQQPDRVSHPDQSQTLSSEVCNITMGSRSTQPDDSSKALQRELLSEVERRSSCEAETKNRRQKSPSPPGQCLTPYPAETSDGKPSVTQTNPGGMPWTGPFSAGVERLHREQDLWSSGNQTGIDGSYLGFLPQSQSTPGVFKAPSKSCVKATLGQLSAIESNKESSCQSSTEISPHPAIPEPDVHGTDMANQCQEEHTSSKVQSLPSLNYMQKVDAWRANQSSGKTSLFDSLALQGFSGISPKKKAYDAVSDTLNRILSQQAKISQQPPLSSAANQNVTQSSSTAPSGFSSPKRGEAVGSAPSDKDNTGSAARPSASSFGRSQSHSSLSTVVMSIQKDQRTFTTAEKDKSQTQNDVQHQPSAKAQPSPLMSLGQFSDVSVDRDLTLSSSQDSYNSGIKLGTSIGASSVTSLEVDNYAPYWTSKPSTPPPPEPRPPELNIEERIPLYLQNLGIDQSPSTILTPFAPRGPIREPEFSPTDLCTIKGSVGTPSKSTQPSEGGSPHKGEFSRSSILSVDSSISIPLSLDSLGLAVSMPEQSRRVSPSSDTEALLRKYRMAPSSQSDEDSHSSILKPSQQHQKDSSLNTSQIVHRVGDRFGSDFSSVTDARCRERDLESPLQRSHSPEQSAEDSFVSTKALWEIRKLLSRVDKAVSAGPSAASSASPAAPLLLSDNDIFLSLRKKTSRVQDSSFSSSGTEDPRTHSSLLWARSSSDSMLTSEKQRQSSTSRESVTSSRQPEFTSTQSPLTAPDADKQPQDSTVSGGVGFSLVLSKSARRAEPEGCSAAPTDNKVPTQPPVIKPLPAVSTQQLTSTPTETADVPEEGGPIQSSSSSATLKDADQEVMSDGSSESSLAVRVAKLLQSESPATMVSSTPSITDQEESKAREWIKLKVSGQQCELLELNIEDRRRVEEIKRELLLRNPMKSQSSTDTESSATSSVRVPWRQNPPQSAETFTNPPDTNNQLSQPLQGLSMNLSCSSVQLQNPLDPGLEAQVREIAAREGVILSRTNPQALTSITIATRRRSTSPVPPVSTALEPLHLTELSTGAVEHPKAHGPPAEEEKTTTEPASVFEPGSGLYTRKKSSQLLAGNQRRQEAVGGQFEEPPPPSQGLKREDVNIKDDNTQSLQRDDELSNQDGSFSGANRTEQTTVSSISESHTMTGHVSHVHLTLSPKATDHSVATAIHSCDADAVTGPPSREFVPLKHSTSAATSPDEGVGSSSPPEWYETREPITQQGHERADTSTLFKTVVPQGKITPTSKQSFTPHHKLEVSRRPLTNESPAVPVLLPYKPRGSEELFYVPQTEADVSPTSLSDTTMESSHTGSDDAVPPCFSSEVLGHQDPGLDRGVTIRHTEGIYSKRLKTATFKMQEPGHRDASAKSVRRTPNPSSQESAAFTRVPLLNNQDTSKKDKGTSPVQFLCHDPPELSSERFQRVHVEVDYDKASHHLEQRSIAQKGRDHDQQRKDPDIPQPTLQQSSSRLDLLWQRFCDQWAIEESRPTSDRESSLVERLERLSRLIHSTRGTGPLEVQEAEGYRDHYTTRQKLGKRGEDAVREEKRQDVREGRRSLHDEARETEWRVRGSRKFDDEPPISRKAWMQNPQVQRTSQSPDDEGHASFTSSLSTRSSQSQYLCPADRDETETLSTVSSSMSTIDTARLIRVFGAHRVRHLKTSPSLSKLYNTINKQKDGREQRRGRNKDSLPETTGSDESTVATDSATSTSTSTLPSHHGPSKTPAAKKAVKMVSKSIQTGDLEIVSNGTRRHTRDVGTTFPSPHETRASGQISSPLFSTERGRGGRRSPFKIQPLQKQRKSKQSLSKPHPEGVTWFISADDLRSEARKENQEEEPSPTWKPSTAWFEPYGRTQPWREPLRQRQVHEDRNKRPGLIHPPEPDPDPRPKTVSSGLASVSLREALEMRRPEFIFRSTQRVKHLALHAEERKLQAVFARERHELFNQPGGSRRLPKPAGTTLLRRAVPRKEMIQRSKQIYENLPEVQMRREEERRKAEYRSYRLNAQLYNKRITDHVLGRRTAWHGKLFTVN